MQYKESKHARTVAEAMNRVSNKLVEHSVLRKVTTTDAHTRHPPLRN